MVKQEDLERNRIEMPPEVKLIIKSVIGVIIVIIVLILVFGSWYIVNVGQRAIVVTLGNPSSITQPSGIHLKIPLIQHIERMNIRTQTINFDNMKGTGDITEVSSLFCASKDLQDVQIATVVNYHINENDVLYIFKQYGNSNAYQKNILEPIVRETVKSVSAQYTAEELVTKRTQFSDDVAKLLQQRFEDKKAVFERYNVVNFEFSEQFTKAIEAKVTAEQNALAEKNKLEMVKYQAQQRIEQSQGEAKAIEIQVNAINKQGGQAYVNLQAIQKWDGKMPLFVGGSSVPFIDFNSMTKSSVTTTP